MKIEGRRGQMGRLNRAFREKRARFYIFRRCVIINAGGAQIFPEDKAPAFLITDSSSCCHLHTCRNLQIQWFSMAPMKVLGIWHWQCCSCAAGMYGHLILSAARRMVLNHGAAPGYCASAPIKGPSMITLLTMEKVKKRGKLQNVLREQKARLYIIRRCVVMLLCWSD
uniref:Uncharacterized protein n=2 Tax=Oryza glumipatula TaxID=40148 RepID=A0A0E0B150_9ORYZ